MYNFNPIGYQVAYTNFALNQLQNSPMTPPLTPPNSLEGSETNSSPNSSNTSDQDNLHMGTIDSSKIKRTRTAFTNDQLMDLEREFQRSVYLDRTRRIGIAERLGLMDKQVKVWFQNRRMKSKKSIIPNGNRVVKPQQAHHGIVKRLMSFTQDPNNLETMKPPNRVTTTQPTTTPQIVQKKIDTLPPKPLPLPVLKPMAAHVVTGPVQFQQQTKPFKPQLIIQLPSTGRPPLQQIPTQNTFIVPKTENGTQDITVRQLRTGLPTSIASFSQTTNKAKPQIQQVQQVVYRPALLTHPNQQGQLHQPRNVLQVQQQHFNRVPTSGSNQVQFVQIQQVHHIPQQFQQTVHQNVNHYQNGIVPHQMQCQEAPRQPEKRPQAPKLENPQPEPSPQVLQQNPTTSDSTRSKTPEDFEMDLYESLILSLDNEKEPENTSYSVDLSAILDNLVGDYPNSQNQVKSEESMCSQPEQSQQPPHVQTAQQDQQLNFDIDALQHIKIETDETQPKVEQQESPQHQEQPIMQPKETMPMDCLEDIKPLSFDNFVASPKQEDYDFDLDDFVENLDKYTSMSYLNSSQDPMLGHTSHQDYSFSFNSSALLEPYASTSQGSVATLTPPDSSFNFEPAVPIVNISFDDCMDPQSMNKEPTITYSF